VRPVRAASRPHRPPRRRRPRPARAGLPRRRGGAPLGVAAGLRRADAVQRGDRLLQFFDGLAVWLNLRAPDGDASWTFPGLPGAPADLHVTAAGRRLGVGPWPFAGDRVEVAIRGRRYVPAGHFEPADEVEQRLVLHSMV
jgi:hypothetical protein